jgi:hypothetical protein
VLDDLVAERLARHAARAEQLARLAEPRGDARLVRQVRIALVGRLER